MNEFIRQNLLLLHYFIHLYLGFFRGYLDKILQRHCAMMEVLNGRERFFIWQIILYGDALSQSYTKLGNRDFVSKFAERIEDSNL